MSAIGYYRYKTIADEIKQISFYKNGVLEGTKTIIPLKGCSNYIRLKYLDKNGQYRFTAFNNRFRTYDNPSAIGTINKIITNIYSGQTNRVNTGYKNDRKIDLTNEFSESELEKLIDLYTSPIIYLYIGTGNSDNASDWVEVSIQVSDAVVHRRRGTSNKIDVTLTLPENFNITLG